MRRAKPWNRLSREAVAPPSREHVSQTLGWAHLTLGDQPCPERGAGLDGLLKAPTVLFFNDFKLLLLRFVRHPHLQRVDLLVCAIPNPTPATGHLSKQAKD